MKKASVSLLWLGLIAGSALASGGNVGLGFVVGEPSGISAKIATGKTNSVNLSLGYGYDYGYGEGSIHMGGDYVWYNYNLIPVAEGKLPLYFGPGVVAWAGDHSSIGVRGVVGLEYLFATAPFDAFFEIGPGISVIPATEPDISVGIGARYLF